MAKQWTRAQLDLFEEPPPGLKLGATERTQALEQLQALLMEAIAAVGDGLETDDVQNNV